jgi:hypothetical protein
MAANQSGKVRMRPMIWDFSTNCNLMRPQQPSPAPIQLRYIANMPGDTKQKNMHLAAVVGAFRRGDVVL